MLQDHSHSLTDYLTNIQSIYDRATNRILLLRLRWPSSAPTWTELTELAEDLGQGRSNFGAVLKVLVEKERLGAEFDGSS